MMKKIILAALSMTISIAIGFEIVKITVISDETIQLQFDCRKLETATVVTTWPSRNDVDTGLSRGRTKIDNALHTKVEPNVVSNKSDACLQHDVPNHYSGTGDHVNQLDLRGVRKLIRASVRIVTFLVWSRASWEPKVCTVV